MQTRFNHYTNKELLSYMMSQEELTDLEFELGIRLEQLMDEADAWEEAEE